jgi:Lysylphosphatidylglycerol synthase TM region
VPGSIPKIILEDCCKRRYIFGKRKLLNKNIKIFFNYFLGPIIFTWLAISIYQQIRHQPDLEQHLKYIREAVYGTESWKFWLVILLMFFNWGLEARKWKVLLLPLEKLSFGRAFKAILAGVAFALNTPNRIGEYGGRVLFLPEGKRIRAVSLTIAGSFSQLIITLVLGICGLFILSDAFALNQDIARFSIWLKFLKAILVVITVICILIYFRISWIIRGVEKLPGVSKFVQHISVLEDLSVILLLRILSLSFARFIIFIIQYNLLLQVMHVNIGWWAGFWTVSVLFLWLAIWPTIALLELGLRWEYSLILFSMYSQNYVGIYAAATCIWLINLVLPAMAGSLFMLGLRIFKER